MVCQVLGRVFRHVRYIMGAAGVAFTVLSAALLLPNADVILQVFSSGAVSLSLKFSFLFGLYGSLATNFTLFSGLYLVLVAVLFGINIGLLTFYIRRRQVKSRNTTAPLASLGGIVSAALGIGCAACGSVILTAVLSIFGAGGLLVFLPLHGIEFQFIGILMLCFSIYYLIKRINDPLICKTKLGTTSIK